MQVAFVLHMLKIRPIPDRNRPGIDRNWPIPDCVRPLRHVCPSRHACVLRRARLLCQFSTATDQNCPGIDQFPTGCMPVTPISDRFRIGRFPNIPNRIDSCTMPVGNWSIPGQFRSVVVGNWHSKRAWRSIHARRNGHTWRNGRTQPGIGRFLVDSGRLRSGIGQIVSMYNTKATCMSQRSRTSL